jgi:serine/threonine protein kinase/WD40 repeat protein
MALPAGTRLGPYEVVALLGVGGMGEVYRARDSRLARDVAVKILPGTSELDSTRIARFEQEARAAGTLNHPNIVVVFDVGADQGLLYIVEELLEGETVRDRLRKGTLPLSKTIECGVQVCSALSAAHAKGIVHRDLKPENLFLTNTSQLKVLDFGLAKLMRTTTDGAGDVSSAPTETLSTKIGTVVGTPGYMSPEQVRGLPVDHRSDIFSLGVILFELLTGKRAFQEESLVETMSAILKQEPPDASALNPSLPVALDRIVHHCMEKNPEDRFQSAQDLGFALKSLSSVSTTAPALSVKPRRNRRILAPAATLLAFAAGALLFNRRHSDMEQYRFTAVAMEQGDKSWPAWSADGKTLAYAAQINGVYQIFTRGLNQAVPAQVTQSAIDCKRPFWSHDSTHIFYVSRWKPRDLWEVTAAGGASRLKIPDVLAADLSPDGKTLAFARQDPKGNVSVWVQPVDSPDARKLGSEVPGSLAVYSAFIRFSPDGGSIGMWSSVASISDFWLFSYPSGKAKRGISVHSGQGGDPELTFSWFPDSRHIVFSGATPNSRADHLLLAEPTAGEVHPITAGFHYERDPAISPDGTQLMFAASDDYNNIVEVPLDGGPMRTVMGTAFHAHCPAWLPAGGQLAYSRDRNGSDEIWTHSVLEGWDRPLITRESFHDTRHTDRVSEASYSPDGQRIAFLRESNGVGSIWVASVAGGIPVPLTSQPDAGQPAWSPDGKWITYLTTRGKVTLWKIPASGGDPVQLAPEKGNLPSSRPKWSPRGDWIVLGTAEGLWLHSADGNKSMAISPDPFWAAYGFSKDGAEIVAIRLNTERHFLTVAIDIATKRERIISDLGPATNAHAFALAPDGKSFLTAMLRGRGGDLWMLEGFPQPRDLFRRWYAPF